MARRRTMVLIVLTGVLIVMALAGTLNLAAAAAVGGPGYASVPGPAFQPEFPSTQFEYFHMQVRTQSGTGFFVAPVYLPEGARLNQLTLLGYDDDPANVLQVTFYRAFQGRGFTEQIAQLDSTGASSDFELSTTTDATRSVVDNEKYGYFLELRLPAPSATNRGLVLSRARIGYSFATNLALVLRNH